jgi:hypothetical protein
VSWSRWPSHDHIAPLLKVADEVIRYQLCHQIIAVPEAAATIALKGLA